MRFKKYWQIWVAAILTILIALAVTNAGAAMQFRIKYGAEAIVNFPLYDSNQPWALYETVPNILDCNMYIDQAATVPPNSVPVDGGPYFSWEISPTEATCKTFIMTITDISAPPLYMDQTITVTTYGHASAFEPILSTAETVSDPLTAAAAATANWADANGVRVYEDANTAAVNSVAILADTDDIGVAGAGLTESGGTGDQLVAIPAILNMDTEGEWTTLGAGISAAAGSFDYTDANWVTVATDSNLAALNSTAIVADTVIIGPAVALDSGTQTITGMLTKMADDNGGADFNATDDSLNKVSDAVAAVSVAASDPNAFLDMDISGKTVINTWGWVLNLIKELGI